MVEPIVLPGKKRPARSRVITVGTFDGLHRGHQAVLDALCSVAREHGKPSLVVTFEPHPLYVIRPEQAPKLLCTSREKLELLHASGVDEVVVVPFTPQLAEYSPHDFVELVLRDHFGLEHLVIGYDHGFGKGRSGDAATLQHIGRELGFEVTVVPHTDLRDAPISSSRIRRLLSEGNVREAAAALGRNYSIVGTVVRGDGRGKALGFPTANIQVTDPHKLLPAEGIYAVRVDPDLTGVLHLGPRPTFEGAQATVEVFLFDFDGDLYGQELTVHFIDRIRGVERFESVEQLVKVMHGDVARGRELLRK